MLLCTLLIFWGYTGRSVWAHSVLVTTEYGPVRGRERDVSAGGQVVTVDEFRGLPYGKDTSGSRRFRSPDAPDPWTDVLDVTQPAASCSQVLEGTVSVTNPGWDNISEDCLNLDIYSPNATDPNANYPVMVWIHGGGFSQGASIQFPGQFLATQGVVVVIVNYRLGKFGFAYTGNAACPGNAGLWDVKLALDFVRNNIENFGGDPNKITVFGQSAGAALTGLVLLSPQTNGLFHQAIFQSGAETNFWVFNAPESQPEDYIRQVASDLDCLSGSDDFQMMDCLRNVSVDDILFNSSAECTPGYFCLPMAPVVDGPGGILPKTPRELRADGDIMTGPIVSGIMRNDGALSATFNVPGLAEDCCNRTTFLRGLAEGVLGPVAPGFDNGTFEEIIRAIDWNYAPWPYVEDLEGNRQAITTISTDIEYLAAWDTQLKDHQALATSYGFVFDYKSNNSPVPDWMGSIHAAELPYVWGLPMLRDNPDIANDGYLALGDYDEEDMAYSLYIQELWSNFAKYGNPTFSNVDAPSGGPTEWPAFDLDTMSVLYLGKDDVRPLGPYEQKSAAFWTRYMEHIVNGMTDAR